MILFSVQLKLILNLVGLHAEVLREALCQQDFFCPTWIIFVKIERSDKGFSVWACDFAQTITVNSRIYCLLMVLWAEFSETAEMKERCLFHL